MNEIIADRLATLPRERLIGMIEQNDCVDVGNPRQLAEGLVHEQTAAVTRRTDRIG